MPLCVPLTVTDVAQVLLSCAVKQHKPTLSLLEVRDFLQPMYSVALLAAFQLDEGADKFPDASLYIFSTSDREVLRQHNEIWHEMCTLLGEDIHVAKLQLGKAAISITTEFSLPIASTQLNKLVLFCQALFSFCKYRK